jgi:hypothetical protein
MEFRGAPVFRPRELAHDLGRAAAWCGFVHAEPNLHLVASAVLVEGGGIAMHVGAAKTDQYYQRTPMISTAEAALAAFGYQAHPENWVSLGERIFVFADCIPAHERIRTIRFLLRSGLSRASEN